MYLRILKTLLFLSLPFTAVQAESLSYSGRLVNANGSAVTGPVHLKFDLAYTNNLSTILCTHDNPGVDLINGVFHAKLDFVCPSSSLNKVLEEIPSNNSIAIRVTDLSQTPVRVYSFQALHSVPQSLMSEMSKQLVQMGATDGQVLTWSSSGWVAADPASTTNGTVTSVTATDGLYGGTITDSGIIGLSDGGVTSQKINQMGAVSGQVLKWTIGGWAPASEEDPHVLKFARSDLMAMPIPDNCAADEKLQYAPAMQTFVCAPIVLSDSAVQSAVVVDAIIDNETEKAPSQNAVFDALAGKQNTIDQSTDLTVKSLKIQTDGSTWMGLVAPTSSSNKFFMLPANDGSSNQVLKTDGAGNLGWMDVNPGTITGITTTAPLAGSGTSGSINISLSADSITNSHISTGASIDWTKINKTGATASDVGASPTTRQLLTSTGLLGGGNLSADRTLSVDVGTNAGQILQVGTDGKLPVVDGSKLTNLEWSQILTSTLPTITAGVGLTTTGSLVSGQTLNVDVGTTANKIVRLDGSARLPAVDGSQLTNLGSNLGKWSDATGGIHYSSGSVGIGTTTPKASLHIHNASGTPNLLLSAGSKDIATVDGEVLQFGHWNLGTSTFTERMTISSNGNIGVGTTNPKEKFSLLDGALLFQNTTLNQYKVPTSDEFRVFLHDDQTSGNPYGTNNNNAVIFENQDGNNNPPDDGVYFVNTGSDGIPQHALAIKGNGNVGVGNAHPTTKLEVAGEVRVGNTGSGCTAANEGAIRYSSTNKNLEFCNGTAWIGMESKPAVPSGAVQAFARNTCPAGWLNASGQAVSRTTYANLFAAIGTNFGTGNGSTTFNLPELRGEFIRGWDNGRGKDPGRSFASTQKGSVATGDDGNGVNSIDFAGSHFANSHDKALATDFPGLQASSAIADNQGYYTITASNGYFGVTRPHNVALLFCIKE